MIDPRAVVDPAAQLAPDVTVGPFSVIGPGVEIGAGTWIGPHVVIQGPTRIGCDNRIFQFASPVSYTHLDVYKRQGLIWSSMMVRRCTPAHKWMSLKKCLGA